MNHAPPTAQRVRGNVLWLLADRGWRLILNIAVLGVLARHLGVEEFGRLNYAASLAAIFATLASLGLEGLIVRELVRRPEDWRTLLGTAAGLRLAGGFLALLVVGLAAMGNSDGHALAVLAMLVACGFVPQALEVTDLWFQKEIQSRYTAVARGVAAALDVGREVITYHTLDEAAELLKRLAREPARAAEVGRAGRCRVRAERIWATRIGQLAAAQ